MGKRYLLILATFLIALAQIGGLVISGEDGTETVHSLTAQTKAQEVNPDKSMAMIAKSGILSDALSEQVIVTENKPQNTSVLQVVATAYTSDPAETDSTPFTTALGTETRDGVAAANFLPFGTKFMIPDIYGDKVFTVEDRMNSRFNNQRIVDIWFSEKDQAIRFGKQYLTIHVL